MFALVADQNPFGRIAPHTNENVPMRVTLDNWPSDAGWCDFAQSAILGEPSFFFLQISLRNATNVSRSVGI
jgi:hypothetical protein